MEENWVVLNKKADFAAIAARFGISPITARVIRNRDVTGNVAIEKYLNGGLESLYDPHLLKDADLLCDILSRKISEGKNIRIIGDYDVDGVMATYILYKGITRCGGRVSFQIPDRVKDGYGINDHLIEEARADGADTIVTCDNGIAAIDEIAYARELGMTVLVTDHHDVPYEEIIDDAGVCVPIQEGNCRMDDDALMGRQPSATGEGQHISSRNAKGDHYEQESQQDSARNSSDAVKKRYIISAADAVVNPKQADCHYPFDGICGATVAWKVIQILYEKCGVEAGAAEEFLENVAFATVGDVMDLVDENRVIVREGLKRLRDTKNMGMRALIEANGLDLGAVGAYHIGFVLGPCVNAAGRLETARKALNLLLQEDTVGAAEAAAELVARNGERKGMTAQGLDEALRQVAGGDVGDKVYVAYLPGLHESLAGIVAGRVREATGHPAFVITDAEDGVKGSGRSIEGYSMYDELCKCSHLFTKFGGHPMAAGLSMASADDVRKFRDEINACCALNDADFSPKVKIDIAMPADYPDAALVRELERLAPFGKGNPKPLFADRELRVRRARIFGQKGNVLRLDLLTQNGRPVQAVWFGDPVKWRAHYEAAFGVEAVNLAFAGRANDIRMSIVYEPEIDSWNGEERVQLIIRHYR